MDRPLPELPAQRRLRELDALSGAAVLRIRQQDDECGDRADEDRIEVHAQSLHETLLGRVRRRGRGRGVRHRTDTGLIGEQAALHTDEHDRSQRSTGDRIHAERVGDDRGDHRRHGTDVHHHDDDADDEVEAGHDRHQVCRDVRDALGAAREDREGGDGDDRAGHGSEDAVRTLDSEGRPDGVDDGVRLHRVEYDAVGDGDDDGEDQSEPLHIQPVPDVVGRTAAEVRAVLELVQLAECRLGEGRGAADDGRQPHPEHRTRTTERDR